MDEKTLRVKEMYSEFPYPYPDQQNGGLDDVAVYMKFFERENNVSFANARILDAGCGTGHRTVEIAKAYPAAMVVGIDMTTRSLNEAHRQVAEMNLSNVEFFERNLLEPLDFAPFDFIVSTGVIHHLENPVLGLSHLVDILSDNGFLLLWLYGAIGEFDRRLNRELVRSFMTSADSFADGIDIIRDLGLGIEYDRYGNSYADNEITKKVQNSIDADALLHEIVEFMRIDDIIELFRKAHINYFTLDGITLSGEDTLRAVLTNKTYLDNAMKFTDIKKFLSANLLKKYNSFDKQRRARILELLYKPVGYTVLGWKKSPQAGERITDATILLNG